VRESLGSELLRAAVLLQVIESRDWSLENQVTLSVDIFIVTHKHCF
jgi:hypothetical protein